MATTPSNFNMPRTPSIQTSPGITPATPSFTQQPVPAVAGRVDRLMELRLMHQYTSVTSKTLLTNFSVTEDIWQKTVPELAFAGKTYLANAILSVAALHLRSQTPEDKALVRASHAYAASTLAEYCTCLDMGITPDNAEALFLTASLIAIQASASRIFIKEDAAADPNDPAERYTLPLPWFHAFQGVKTVVASSWQWIRNSTAVQAVIDSQPSVQLDLNPVAPDSFFGHILDGLELELATEDPRFVTATSQGYSHAICVLNWAHRSPIPAAALAFPATVSRRFIDLVEAKRPRALAILACFFALLKRMEGMWWLRDVSRREVMGLVGIFESGSKWWRHLEWPVRIALWDSGPIPSDVWGVDCDVEMQQDDEFVVETMMSHIELMAQMLGQSQQVPSLPMNGDHTDHGEPILEAASPD